MVEPEEQPLTRDQVSQVLRYWLRGLRYQEALTARPKARRGNNEPANPNGLLEPLPGQDYMKLPYAGAAAFLCEQKGFLERPLDKEGWGFFEHWLAERYRHGGDSPEQVQHLVFFPSLLLPRGELAGLLRFETKIQFQDEARKPFVAPSAEARGKQLLPTPPSLVRLQGSEPESDESLPYFVDARALRDIFAVSDEALDAFFSKLRAIPAVTPSTVVTALCALLENTEEATPEPASAAVAAPAPSPDALLSRLVQSVETRLRQLGSNTRTFPVALLVSSSVSRTTWHVQRDLEAAIDSLTNLARPTSPALLGYLQGGHLEPAPPSGLALGRLTSQGLTNNQCQTLEGFLEARLCAVQGPPGTGKTTLILNAIAHALIEHVAPLLKGGSVLDATWVVTSTNNKAVDNVIDQLRQGFPGHALPLGLRIGSRAVLEKVTSVELDRCKRWLENAPAADDSEFEAALEAFRERFTAFEPRLAHLKARRAHFHSVEQKQAELQALTSGEALSLAWEQVRVLVPAVTLTSDAPLSAAANANLAVIKRLKALSKASERGKLDALDKHWRKTQLGPLKELALALGCALDTGLPPSTTPAATSDDWEEAIEESLAWFTDLELALSDVSRAQAATAERARLEQALAELQAHPVNDAESTAPGEATCYELFQAALRLHHAWTLKHKAPLVKTLAVALGAARSARSLRRLMETPGGTAAWLRRLFPAWGCTLLSLGNNFPPEPCITRVIIDEAGQCHPAYAVSALLRARSALVIGDVHQLEPVVDMSQEDDRRMCRIARMPLDFPGARHYRVHETAATSAQHLADRAVAKRFTLVDHFRCQPAIAAISDALCDYGLVIHTKPASRRHEVPELSESVIFQAVLGEQTPYGGSWSNRLEVEAALDWLRRLLRAGISPGDIAVITPFRGQLMALSQALRSARIPFEQEFQSLETDTPTLFHEGRVAIGTVHRFQGGERSIVLFSATVTRTTSLRFLDERVNLLNVAVSRARDHLITLGHTPTLRAGRITGLLVPSR
jgi:AAA domain